MSLARQPEVISLDPQLLGDIIENVRMLGRATGAEEKADAIAEDMEARIQAVAARAADAAAPTTPAAAGTRNWRLDRAPASQVPNPVRRPELL